MPYQAVSLQKVDHVMVVNLNDMVSDRPGMDRPVIAAIHGDAIGQGLEMALACDIRIAVETSRLGMPQIKAGLIPWDGGTQRLTRLVGRGKALEMILTGETIRSE